MVALGDSYTAGALLPVDTAAKPVGCLRSTKAYPALVARALGARLVDVSCASAGVKNMTAAQQTYLGTNPAAAQRPRAGRPAGAAYPRRRRLGLPQRAQGVRGAVVHPAVGQPVRRRTTPTGGTDQLAASVAAEGPKISQVLAQIADRAPRARIVVVGYPDMFPQSGGCWPAVPITAGDVAYLRGIEVKANALLAAAAQAAGATFVNTYAPTIGHDFCQPESVRDVEGLLPGSLALPFHPNVRGQAAMAAAVLKAVKG